MITKLIIGNNWRAIIFCPLSPTTRIISCTDRQQKYVQISRHWGSLWICEHVLSQERQGVGRVANTRPCFFFCYMHRHQTSSPDFGLKVSHTAIVSIGKANCKNPCLATNESNSRQSEGKCWLLSFIRVNTKIIQLVPQKLIFSRCTFCTHRQQALSWTLSSTAGKHARHFRGFAFDTWAQIIPRGWKFMGVGLHCRYERWDTHSRIFVHVSCIKCAALLLPCMTVWVGNFFHSSTAVLLGNCEWWAPRALIICHHSVLCCEHHRVSCFVVLSQFLAHHLM